MTAAHLGLLTRTVHQFAREGRLPSMRVGGRWCFRRSDLEQWLESSAGHIGSKPDAPMPPPAPDAATLADFLAGFPDAIEKRLVFMGLLTRACVGRGWQPPVIVGGQAVEFYSAGGYATVAVDLVSASEPLDEILPGWGFERRGRHWMRADLGLIVEAPGGRLAPGQRDRLREVEVAGTSAQADAGGYGMKRCIDLTAHARPNTYVQTPGGGRRLDPGRHPGDRTES